MPSLQRSFCTAARNRLSGEASGFSEISSAVEFPVSPGQDAARSFGGTRMILKLPCTLPTTSWNLALKQLEYLEASKSMAGNFRSTLSTSSEASSYNIGKVLNSHCLSSLEINPAPNRDVTQLHDGCARERCEATSTNLCGRAVRRTYRCSKRQAWQNQSPSGTDSRGGFRQSMHFIASHPSQRMTRSSGANSLHLRHLKRSSLASALFSLSSISFSS
mmetsp:Transcript_40298/g.78419  ORF Transcript_40298/g.78419 Transcript_40298/m.78419 type:complete len:218 (+) Transcript_40298:925-1578(+)